MILWDLMLQADENRMIKTFGECVFACVCVGANVCKSMCNAFMQMCSSVCLSVLTSGLGAIEIFLPELIFKC